MSKTANNPAQQSDDRIDNLFRILESPETTASGYVRMTLKLRSFLDKVYLDGFEEGMSIGIDKSQAI